MQDVYIIPLSPPLIVSGRTMRGGGEESVEFTDALAVAMGLDYRDDALCHDYHVVLPSGSVHEVNDSMITSALPWTPPTVSVTATDRAADAAAVSDTATRIVSLMARDGSLSMGDILGRLPRGNRAHAAVALSGLITSGRVRKDGNTFTRRT